MEVGAELEEDEVEEETEGGEGGGGEEGGGDFLGEQRGGLVVEDFSPVEALEGEEGWGLEGMEEGVMVEDPWEGRGWEVSLGTDSNHIECHFVLLRFFFNVWNKTATVSPASVGVLKCRAGSKYT